MRLLVVEDDPDLAGQLRSRFEHEGYAVDVAGNGIDGAHLGATEAYDAAVLDLGLPGKPGLDVLREWRAAGSRLPVLILTARNGWAERVEGLQAGADDYLGKPFHVEELLARLQALLRRSAPAPTLELRAGRWRLDEARQCLCGDDGGEQTLTATEFRLLRYFMRHPDEVLSKTQLYEHVYDHGAEHDSNVIEVYVRRLRSLLGNERIETRRGQGYRFLP
ncbi:response regulator transcription factor [Thauera sp. Sel9]|uniref:response regulator transcription factor n=1 Tax=Thauera sp. Sel9 TaxID=2974299 RepID=UPI0021E19412|nr:response regulator transcription factor [Thauera sp. Sel9]MCV2219105.1 response regulator transcription factor [Thauera sp. Sel9]